MAGRSARAGRFSRLRGGLDADAEARDREPERRERPAFPLRIPDARRARAKRRAAHRRMIHVCARRKLEAPPRGPGEEAVRLPPRAEDAAEVEPRHSSQSTHQGPMKGPSTSASRMITTTTMHASESASMKGAIHDTSFWSGGKSICLSAISVSFLGRRAGGRRGRAVERAGGPQLRSLAAQLTVLEDDEAPERDDHGDDAEHGHDPRAGGALAAECPELREVAERFFPRVVRERVEH